jgi:hypothetical protein
MAISIRNDHLLFYFIRLIIFTFVEIGILLDSPQIAQLDWQLDFGLSPPDFPKFEPTIFDRKRHNLGTLRSPIMFSINPDCHRRKT